MHPFEACYCISTTPTQEVEQEQKKRFVLINLWTRFPKGCNWRKFNRPTLDFQAVTILGHHVQGRLSIFHLPWQQVPFSEVLIWLKCLLYLCPQQPLKELRSFQQQVCIPFYQLLHLCSYHKPAPPFQHTL